jgi:hypothetical protein
LSPPSEDAVEAVAFPSLIDLFRSFAAHRLAGTIPVCQLHMSGASWIPVKLGPAQASLAVFS